MSKADEAVRCFDNGVGFNCCQSVLATYGRELGLDRETALRLATTFGSGMARMGDTCGAVTSAMMVIGLKHGRTRVEDEDARERAYGLVHEFITRFKARNGSIVCRDLLGCDPGSPEGQAFLKETGRHKSVCPKLIRDTAEILEDIL